MDVVSECSMRGFHARKDRPIRDVKEVSIALRHHYGMLEVLLHV